MRLPDELHYFTRCFWNGSDEEASTPEEWIATAVRLLDAHKKKIVKRFLDDILARNLSGEELHRIWMRRRCELSVRRLRGTAAFPRHDPEPARGAWRTIVCADLTRVRVAGPVAHRIFTQQSCTRTASYQPDIKLARRSG